MARSAAKKPKKAWLLVTKTCPACNLVAYKILSKPHTPLDEYAALEKITEGTPFAERLHRDRCASIEVFEIEIDGKIIKTETKLDF